MMCCVFKHRNELWRYVVTPMGEGWSSVEILRPHKRVYLTRVMEPWAGTEFVAAMLDAPLWSYHELSETEIQDLLR